MLKVKEPLVPGRSQGPFSTPRMAGRMGTGRVFVTLTVMGVPSVASA